MNFFRNVTGMLLTSTFNVPIQFATSVILARWLTPDDRGLYAVAIAFATMTTLLSQIGMPSAAIYRIGRMRSDPAEVATAGVIVMAIISAVVVGICLLVEPFLTSRFLDNAPSRVFFLALVLIPIELQGHLFGHIARGIDRFALRNWYRIGITVGTLIAMVLALIVWEGALQEAIIALAVVHGVATVIMVCAVLWITGFSFRWNGAEIVGGLRFGLKSYVQGLAGKLHEKVDIFMISYLLMEPSQVAFYAIAVSTINRIKMVPNSLAAASFPQLARQTEGRGATFACAVSRQSTLWVVVSAVGLALIAPTIIPLIFGEAYTASVQPFMLLLPGVVLLTTYRILSRWFAAQNRQQVNIATQVISVITNVALNLYLIPRYGILGAAGASLASYSLEAVLITGAFMRAAGKGPVELFVFRRSDFEAYRRRAAPLLQRIGLGSGS